MILLVTYSANLISFLTISERKMPFTTLQGAIEEESVPFKMWGGGATRSMVEVSSEGKI